MRELDAAVARALGLTLAEGARAWVRDDGAMQMVARWHPSTDWKQGGPIIERERIELFYAGGAPERCRWQGAHRQSGMVFTKDGPTPLIAAMRAFVASKQADQGEQP